jgi:hypothetical protein
MAYKARQIATTVMTFRATDRRSIKLDERESHGVTGAGGFAEFQY